MQRRCSFTSELSVCLWMRRSKGTTFKLQDQATSIPGKRSRAGSGF